MSILDPWNPDSLSKYSSFVMTFLGGKRTGKSFCMAYLVERLKDRFDLVISFCGSMSCSPELQELFETYFDSRFMFEAYNIRFLEVLRRQQEELKNQGKTRRVLCLFDDVEVNSETESALAFFATRHRHFNISMIYCSVRYSHIPKSYRASTDALFLFSTPLTSDREMLLKEFSRNKKFASFCMGNLKQYEALVMTSGFGSSLYTFRIQDDLQESGDDQPEFSDEEEASATSPHTESATPAITKKTEPAEPQSEDETRHTLRPTTA